MSLRVRLGLIFVGLMLLTLVITTGLSWYELIDEPTDPEVGEENREESMPWRLTEIVLRGAGPVILLALLAWWLTQRLFRPIEALTAAARRLQEGRYGEQIPLGGRKDELAQLTAAFNEMSLHVASSFRSIQEFTLHASHELKTPLTLLRASLERRLPKTGIGSEERDELAGQLDEVHRLTKIVDALSLLTKADAQLLRWEKVPVDLHQLVAAAREDAEALADGKDLEIRLADCAETSITGDRFRLRQLLLILADNAVKYNESGGFVSFSLERREDQAVITVINSGPVLPGEEQVRVFDRFYRGTESLGRGIDGSGLGLSIAQWIVNAHAGKISYHCGDSGTVLTVALPLPA